VRGARPLAGVACLLRCASAGGRRFCGFGVALDERHGFGVAQHGDATRTDVARTTLDFSDHQVRVCGLSEDPLRLQNTRSHVGAGGRTEDEG